MDEKPPPDLELDFYGFTEADLERKFKLPTTTFIGGESETTLTLGEIVQRLKNVYSRSIGVEYMHINDFEKRNWIRRKFETPGADQLSAEEKKRALERFAFFSAIIS